VSDTIHANCVTTMLNADELMIEFRRIELTHLEISKRGGKADYTGEDVAKAPVLVRASITFSAAIAFAEQLSNLIPATHEFRVRTSAPWLTEETREKILGKLRAEAAPAPDEPHGEPQPPAEPVA